MLLLNISRSVKTWDMIGEGPPAQSALQLCPHCSVAGSLRCWNSPTSALQSPWVLAGARPGAGVSGCPASPCPSAPAPWSQALDFPLKPGCLSSNNHDFKGLPASRLGSFPSELTGLRAWVSWAQGCWKPPLAIPGSRTESGGRVEEGCSQRICSQLDPPRQGSWLVIHVTPGRAGREAERPGPPSAYFFLFQVPCSSLAHSFPPA